jgi:methionyl-tRNA synthetase
MARTLVAQNPKQAESYRAGKTAILGFFVGQMMKQTGGSADPATVNQVLKQVLSGESPAEVDPQKVPHTPPTHTPENAGAAALKAGLKDPPSKPAPPTPRSPRAPDEQSPLAQSVAPPPPVVQPLEHTTLTSASGVAVLPPPVALPEGLSPDAFARFDLRIGKIVGAKRVPRKDRLLDLDVDVGEERPRRVIGGIAAAYAPETLVGQRVLVVCNLEPRDHGLGVVSDGMILAAGQGEGLTLLTVAGDVPPGTRVK